MPPTIPAAAEPAVVEGARELLAKLTTDFEEFDPPNLTDRRSRDDRPRPPEEDGSSGHPVGGAAADRTAAGRADGGRADAGQNDTGQADLRQADAGLVSAGRANAERVDAGQADAERTWVGQADGRLVDAGHADAGRADAGRADAGQGGVRGGGVRGAGQGGAGCTDAGFAVGVSVGGWGLPAGDGPLGWDGYGLSRARAAARTGVYESVVCGRGVVGRRPAVFVAFEFGFLGGSVGTGTGARIVDAFVRARELRLPVVSLIATGGTRMQEGVPALRQLQLIAREAVRLRESGLPHIAVLRDPTTGGVWASLGAIADVVIAVRGAQVGFAGRRVRAFDVADDRAYTAESQFAAGFVDELVREGEVGGVVDEWVSHLATSDLGAAPVPRALGETEPAVDGWAAVLRARDGRRPRADVYLADYFESRCALRAGRRQDGILCGFGIRDGRVIAFAAQDGTATTPAGFRAATRLVRTADRLRIPVLTLVDTPGAAAGPDAELDGVGPAIAELFATIASARVPVTTLVIGEGGSGGALALCSLDRVWIAPDAYFSVIAPELAAGILKRAPEEVPALAGQLKLRPHDLLELGAVHGIAQG